MFTWSVVQAVFGHWMWSLEFVIQRHEKVDKHLKRLNDINSQATFAFSGQNFFMKRENMKVVLTSELQVWNTVIVCALNVAENNISFNSCDEDNDLYRHMFPDSNITKNYCQDHGKLKYVIQFGISLYTKELMQSDLQGQLFTFHFDETVNSQVKKQCDGYATYFSPKLKEISSAYCWSLHVGKWTADGMLVHFHEFMKNVALSPNFMLALGVDGPNVNLLFKNKPKEEFSIIEMGTCPLHIVNHAFGKAVQALKESIVDLNEMAIDFNFFFKYSAAMRERYTGYPEITGVTAKLMRKHCSTWWFSLEKVLVKLMEQWENLFEYFLRKDPTLPGFTGSKGIFSTARYACIRGYLQSKKIPCCHHICFFVCPGFSKIHKNFRNQCTIDSPTLPKIPAFVAHHIQQIPEGRSFQEKKGDQDYAIKHIKNLKQINVKLQSNHKTSCSFGSQTELQLKKSKLDELEKKRLKRNMEEAMTE